MPITNISVASIPAKASKIPSTAIAINSCHDGGLNSTEGSDSAMVASAIPAAGNANQAEPKIALR